MIFQFELKRILISVFPLKKKKNQENPYSDAYLDCFFINGSLL